MRYYLLCVAGLFISYKVYTTEANKKLFIRYKKKKEKKKGKFMTIK